MSTQERDISVVPARTSLVGGGQLESFHYAGQNRERGCRAFPPLSRVFLLSRSGNLAQLSPGSRCKGLYFLILVELEYVQL